MINILDESNLTHGDKSLEEKNQKEKSKALTDERGCKARFRVELPKTNNR